MYASCHGDLGGLDSVNDTVHHFFEDVGRKTSEVSGDSREGSFIFQRLFHKSFTRHDDPDL